MNDVPVLLTVFNRVDLTESMLNALQEMQPRILYIAADGPRPEVESDSKDCIQVRSELEDINWPCKVFRIYRDRNLGCGRNVSGAITQVLKDYDRLIVLEDDCLPASSFLPFCTEMLERYQSDTRVSMICGSLPVDFLDSSYSYFFSRYYSCWGWATWRRAWDNFDFDIKTWPLMRDSGLLRTRFYTEHEYRKWSHMIQRVYDLERRAWAAQWGYACRQSGGLAVFSHRSLISNIGVGHKMSTHGANKDLCSIWTRKTEDVIFPLRHPLYVLPDMDKELTIRSFIADTQRTLPRIRSRIKAVPSLLRDIRRLVKEYHDIF